MMLRRALAAKQNGKAISYFSFFEHHIAKAGITNQIPEQMLIAIAATNLQPRVMKAIQQDSTKLTPSYSWQQFKDDCCSIDAATYVPNNQRQGSVHLVGEVHSDHADSDVLIFDDTAQWETINYTTGSPTTATQPRRPAYKFPADYKLDKNCRWCRSSDHLAPLCTKLWSKFNPGKDYPTDLKATVTAALRK
jgi:hypothetical protein